MARGEMFVERGFILIDFVEDEAPRLLWIDEPKRLQPISRLSEVFALAAIRSRNCATNEGYTRNSTSTTRGRMIPPPSSLPPVSAFGKLSYPIPEGCQIRLTRACWRVIV